MSIDNNYAKNDEILIPTGLELQTYSVLFRGLFRKTFKNFALNIFTIVCGITEADTYFPVGD